MYALKVSLLKVIFRKSYIFFDYGQFFGFELLLFNVTESFKFISIYPGFTLILCPNELSGLLICIRDASRPCYCLNKYQIFYNGTVEVLFQQRLSMSVYQL